MTNVVPYIRYALVDPEENLKHSRSVLGLYPVVVTKPNQCDLTVEKYPRHIDRCLLCALLGILLALGSQIKSTLRWWNCWSVFD